MQRNKALWVILLLAVSILTLYPTQTAAYAKPHDPKIKHLQQLLADTGFYPGQITGNLDEETRSAIIHAEKVFKLRPTGKYQASLAEVLSREVLHKPKYCRKELTMTATAYTSQDPKSGPLTKREHYLRKGLAAVDPRVIPLGTRLYIEGYGYAIADDIGSAIKGHRIDLAFQNRPAAFQFGRRTIKVLVLD